MARLRRFGNGLQDAGSMFIQSALQQMNAIQQSELVKQRQLELAAIQDRARVAAREDSQAAAEMQSVLGDPTGAKAEMLVRGGKSQYAPYVPGADTATSRYGSGMSKFTKREELPSDVDLETGLSAAPGGASAAKDPTKIEQLIGVRNSRRGVIDEAAQAGIKDTRATAFAQGEGQGAGTEAANAAAHPAKLAREKETFAQMTPLHVRRSAAEAAAQQSAQTAGEAARTKQAWELAAQDPTISGIAEHVLSNPGDLPKVPAAQRGFVMAALKSTKYAPLAQTRSKQILDTNWNALQRMKGNPAGLEGATGNRLMDPSRWPLIGGQEGMGGTATADFTANFNQFKAASALDKIEFIRGMGHMSDADLIIISQAANNLTQNMNEGTFQKGMDEAEAALLRSYQRLGVPPPDSYDPKASAEAKWQQFTGGR